MVQYVAVSKNYLGGEIFVSMDDEEFSEPPTYLIAIPDIPELGTISADEWDELLALVKERLKRHIEELRAQNRPAPPARSLQEIEALLDELGFDEAFVIEV